MMTWLHMGGYAVYVWGAYIMVVMVWSYLIYRIKKQQLCQ